MVGVAETADTLALMLGIGVSLAASLWIAGVTWWDNVAVAGIGGPVIAGGVVAAGACAGACPLVGVPMIVLGMFAFINTVPVLYRWSIWRTQRRGRDEWLASVEWAVVRILVAGAVLAGLLAVLLGPRTVVWRQERQIAFARKGLLRAKFTVSDGQERRAVTLGFYLDD